MSGDDTQIISGASDGTVRLWHRESSVEVGRIDIHGGSVDAGLLSADQQSLFTAGEDARVLRWDLATHSLVSSMLGHRGPVGVLAISPDGAFLATGGTDATVRIWDAQSGAPLAVFPTEDVVSCCTALSDGRFLAGDQSGHFYMLGLST
jgi:WD40 repeat protein